MIFGVDCSVDYGDDTFSDAVMKWDHEDDHHSWNDSTSKVN